MLGFSNLHLCSSYNTFGCLISKYAVHYGTTCSALLFSSIGIFLSFHPVTPPTVRGAENQEGTGVVFTCTVNETDNVTLEWSSTTLTSSSFINLMTESIYQDVMVMNTLTIANVTDAGGEDWFQGLSKG